MAGRAPRRTQGEGDNEDLFGRAESERRLVESPPPQEKSKVAIAKAADYSQAERAVREAIDLLGGVRSFVKPTDTVIIKPNMIAATKPEEGEVTDPAIVEAVVKVIKETGATVKVGEQTGWHGDPLTTFKVTGMYDAAIRGGADEVVNWDQDEYSWTSPCRMPGASAW